MTLRCLILGHERVADAQGRAASEQEGVRWLHERRWALDCWDATIFDRCHRCGKHLPERTVSEAR